MPPRYRPDRNGPHKSQYEHNKKIIYATQTVCGICGRPVDFSVKHPDPLSPCIDHIIPVHRGGHPSELSNLQLAHMCCNRAKSDKLLTGIDQEKGKQVNSNRILPLSRDWSEYRAD